MSRIPAPPLTHLPALDGLRGVAILMVLVFHASGYAIWGFGAMGVDLFFLLSGFLITRLFQLELATSGRIRLGAFVARRALRLIPALWLTVATVLLITGVGYADEAFRIVLRDASATLAYASNWVPILIQQPNRLLGHSWSLSVEVQFYVLWGVLAAWLLPRLAAGALAALLGAVCLGLGAWTAWAYQHGASVAHMVYGFDTRAAPLFAGCAIALLTAMPSVSGPLAAWLRRVRWAGVAALAVLVGLALGFGVALPWILVAYVPSLAVLGGIVLAEIALVPDGRLARVLAARPLAALGVISYGLYLWHFPLMRLADDRWGGWPVRWLVCFGVAPVVAALSWHAVERPALALKARFGVRARPAAPRMP